ncbi:MAG TPA: hypothetical protein VLK82_24670 [Candidatus Tectomicrobia bacterium]|nr:hypothetical protein [Candidatus Tectomicrobia bacterium]
MSAHHSKYSQAKARYMMPTTRFDFESEHTNTDNLVQKPLLSFQKSRVLTLTVFDFGLVYYNRPTFRQKIINSILEELRNLAWVHLEFKKSIDLYYREVNTNVYDCEFANRLEGFEPLEIRFTLDFRHKDIRHYVPQIVENIKKTLISINPKIDPKKLDSYASLLLSKMDHSVVPAVLMIESYGIGILRVEWRNIGLINRDEIIDLSDGLVDTVDGELFKEKFRPILLKIYKKIHKDPAFEVEGSLGSKILTEYLTPRMFLSFDDLRWAAKISYREIARMIWLYNSNFQIDEQLADRAKDENLSLFSGDVFIISRPASIGVFRNRDRFAPYVIDRVELVETLYCQMFLLKKFDIELSEIINASNLRNRGVSMSQLRRNLDHLIAMQQESLTLTEFYRNTYTTASSDHKRLIDAGGSSLGLPRLYSSITEKLEHSHSIVSQTHDRLRNMRLMVLQWAAIIFASITLVREIINPLILRLIIKYWQITDSMEDVLKKYPDRVAVLHIAVVGIIAVVIAIIWWCVRVRGRKAGSPWRAGR